ncbi:MAG: hypothetical protein R3C99_05850 [Pirellulaceae bacterium]|nr:hypothetical protein [Planctomycetales bacterium]
MKRLGWALFAAIAILHTTPEAKAGDLPTAINYVGRFLGWGWSDGYHSGQRPGSGFRGYPGVSAPHGDFYSGGQYAAPPIGESIPAPSVPAPRAPRAVPPKTPSTRFDPSLQPRDAGDDQLPAPPPRPMPEMSYAPGGPSVGYPQQYHPSAYRPQFTPNMLPASAQRN